MAIGSYTVYEVKRKSGTAWMGRVVVSYKNTTPVRKSVSAKTKKQAIEKILALREAVMRGQHASSSKATIFEFGLHYIRDVMAMQVSPKTLGGYEDTLRTYISPYLGRIRLNDLTTPQVEEWMRDIRKKGLSTTTVNGAKKQLSRIMKHALKQDLIVKNVVELADPLRRPKEEPKKKGKPLSSDEAKVWLQTSIGTEMDLFIHLAILTGMRRGEILGLRNCDILEYQKIDINGSLGEYLEFDADGASRTRMARELPKTESAKRVIKLSTPVMESLMRHKEMMLKKSLSLGLEDPEYLFFDSTGGPYWPTNFAKGYTRWVKANNLRYIRIHDLRSTNIHLAYESNVDGNKIKNGVGHSNVETTANVYGRKVPKLAYEYGDVVSDYLYSPEEELGMTVLTDAPNQEK